MIYIVTALKPEAQAIIEKYKLTKSNSKELAFFYNRYIILIISGLGINNSKIKTKLLIDFFDINDKDHLFNIGICGANDTYNIGSLCEISMVNFKDETFILNENTQNTIECLQTPANDNKYNIVDMESFGFYEASKDIKNVRMFKIVSDNFEPYKVTKDKTKKLVSAKIGEIIEKSSCNWS
jgi:purine-nucleoside phosphorylase